MHQKEITSGTHQIKEAKAEFYEASWLANLG